jgi:hypothetical protein
VFSPLGRPRKYKDNVARQRAYRRRKKARRLQAHFSSLLDVRETLADLFAALGAEFGFGTDVCARRGEPLLHHLAARRKVPAAGRIGFDAQ